MSNGKGHVHPQKQEGKEKGSEKERFELAVVSLATKRSKNKSRMSGPFEKC